MEKAGEGMEEAEGPKNPGKGNTDLLRHPGQQQAGPPVLPEWLIVLYTRIDALSLMASKRSFQGTVLYSKHVKLVAHGLHASLIWPVLAFELDMLALECCFLKRGLLV